MGSATIEPTGAFEAGSFASFTLTYTAGHFGVDDAGAIKIVFRFATDMSRPQFDDPKAPGYVTAETSGAARIQVHYDPFGNIRPWDKSILLRVTHGSLVEGDRIIVRLGDPRESSPGMRLQTFCEETFEFRVLADPIATSDYIALPESPVIAVVPAAPERWVAVLPTLRRRGEAFRLSLKAEDHWGNPSDKADATLRLRPSLPVDGLPGTVTFAPGRLTLIIDGLTVAEPGDLVIDLLDDDGAALAASNPLRIADEAPLVAWWGDLHGQSEETVGTNSARDYFAFARDRAFLDLASHQGNDFEITGAFWAELNRLTAEFDEPGRFVTAPGYEWSGNTPMGGDRNVYFMEEGRAIRRSSHALVEGEPDQDTACTTAKALFEALARDGEDVVAYAHAGGRHADIRIAHDPAIERSVELHSAWGSFEWLLEDAFDLGYRVGVVANSDGHKGRPGASYPGASIFGAYGGLTCFLMPELTRAALFDCIRHRRHYGTTGARIHLDVRARFEGGARRHEEDPAVREGAVAEVSEVLMGDIVTASGDAVTLTVDVLGSAPIERVEVFNGRERIALRRPYGADDLGRRIRVIWEGAEYRGRYRQTVWDGHARFPGDRIERVRAINFWNRDKTLEREGEDGLSWQALTTGNFGGFDAWLADGRTGALALETRLVTCDVALADIGLDDVVFEAGGLGRRVRLVRLPDENPHRTLSFALDAALAAGRDNPLWVKLTQEDGHVAWSSPIYVIRG
jgi:hypothetical protein